MGEMRMAACGIDCEVCDSYLATMTGDLAAAGRLVDWYRGQGWIGADEGAEAVLRKRPLCKGCWNGTEDCFFTCGCHVSRDFRVCCTGKGIAHCGECGEFPCEPYVAFVGDNDAHKRAMARLYALRGAE